MTNLVSFPGLGLEFELNRVAVELFGRPIYWYGVIIASGMLLAVYLCGRWGNFMNVEAFGGVTDAPWRMCSESITAYLINRGYATDAMLPGLLDGSLGVHPTFFYESAWNLVGLLAVYYIGKHRKCDGQCFLFYFFWYGLGRTWIEGMRTDSLYFFGLQIMGYPIRVSQMIAAVTCVVAGIAMVWMMRKTHDPADMYVNRLAARKAAQEDSKEKEEE